MNNRSDIIKISIMLAIILSVAILGYAAGVDAAQKYSVDTYGKITGFIPIAQFYWIVVADEPIRVRVILITILGGFSQLLILTGAVLYRVNYPLNS